MGNGLLIPPILFPFYFKLILIALIASLLQKFGSETSGPIHFTGVHSVSKLYEAAFVYSCPFIQCAGQIFWTNWKKSNKVENSCPWLPDTCPDYMIVRMRTVMAKPRLKAK